jgi:hypothetical protein
MHFNINQPFTTRKFACGVGRIPDHRRYGTVMGIFYFLAITVFMAYIAYYETAIISSWLQ